MASSDATLQRSDDRPVERASERLIAADRAVGVRPWTLGSFDSVARPKAPAPAPRVAAEHLPTAAEVEAIVHQAREEGYRAGLAETRADTERAVALLSQLSRSVARLERDMAGSLLTLAIDLARQILRESISVRPELVIPLVEEALAGIARGSAVGALHVHPGDLALVEERMGDALAHAGWKAFADDTVERGGCRVKFDGGEVDATIETRWNRVMSQLERDDAWLA